MAKLDKSALLNIIRQLSSANLTNGSTGGASVTLPSFTGSLDLGSMDLGGFTIGNGGSSNPTTAARLLNSLMNETISVTVPFQTITGTLIAIRSDYIVLVESDGSIVEIPIENIEFVSET